MIIFRYPYSIKKEGPEFIVSFPDFPEALTSGETKGEAHAMACDALLATIGGYVDAKRPIPAPSQKKPRQGVATVDPIRAAKIALYIKVREAELSNAELARRLNLDEKAVRRMFDMDDTITGYRHTMTALQAVFNTRLVTSMEDVG